MKILISIDAYEIAKECGNIKAVNIVLLGLWQNQLKLKKQFGSKL